MKKYKLTSRVIAIILCLSLFLVGCNNKGDGAFNGVDPEKQYKITFFGWGDIEEQRNYQKLVDKFMTENKNITVDYSGVDSGSYMTTLKNKGKNLPDVFYMPDTEFLMWADSGNLLDLSKQVDSELIKSIWPEAVDKYYYNRESYMLGAGEGAGLYGLPKDLGPFTLVYNKTLLNELAAKNGVSSELTSLINAEIPMNWTQFRQLLKALDPSKADDIYGITHYEIEAAVYSNNADFFSEDTTTSKITDKNFTDAMQFIADLYLADGVMPSSDDQTSTNGYQRFKGGKAVFSFMGPWDCANFWEDVKFDYDVMPVPYGAASNAESVAWVGSMAYSISANTKEASASLKLVEYLAANEDGQREFYTLGQQTPNLIEMANDEYVNNTKGLLKDAQTKPASRSVFVDTINGKSSATDKVSGKARARYFTYDSIWYEDFLDQLEPLWKGTKTAAQLMSTYNITFQAALDDMLAQYRG